VQHQSLTPAQFEQLADVPPEEEWLANITNLKTRRTYKEDVRDFIAFTALSLRQSTTCPDSGHLPNDLLVLTA
jgi:hypothetical protein